jgi:hypothetical protein
LCVTVYCPFSISYNSYLFSFLYPLLLCIHSLFTLSLPSLYPLFTLSLPSLSSPILPLPSLHLHPFSFQPFSLRSPTTLSLSSLQVAVFARAEAIGPDPLEGLPPLPLEVHRGGEAYRKRTEAPTITLHNLSEVRIPCDPFV